MTVHPTIQHSQHVVAAAAAAEATAEVEVEVGVGVGGYMWEKAAMGYALGHSMVTSRVSFAIRWAIVHPTTRVAPTTTLE
jgi:hypothetical protein